MRRAHIVRRSSRHAARGQALVMMAVAMVALLAMVALIIDGGNAFAQQRVTQNGADAASEAGTVVIAKRLAGLTGLYDGDVYDAITTSAAANGLTISAMQYTDINGNVLGAPDTNVLNRRHSAIPAAAAGVLVTGTRSFTTYVASIIGLGQMTAGAKATAISGYQASPCDSATGCGVIPLAMPANTSECTGPNDLDLSVMALSNPWPIDTVVSVPICGTASGNVGWLDFNGTGVAGIADSISHPDNPPISIPSWTSVDAEAGDTNSSLIQSALEPLQGYTLLAPMFLHVCDHSVTGLGTSVTDCPADKMDANAGGGTNIKYYIVSVAPFQLCSGDIQECVSTIGRNTPSVYINRTSTLCNDLQRGGRRQDGPVHCLIGLFRSQFITTGTVDRSYTGQYPSTTHQVVVQLIK